MTIIRFDQRRRSARPPKSGKSDAITPALAIAALLSVCTLGWVVADTFLPGGSQAVVASEIRTQFRMCGSGQRRTCVVDGDTIWLDGMNLRLQAYDTPEPYNVICGGAQEVALAKRASARLLDLLNGNSFSVETFGTDRYDRILATIRINGTDVGDILISEGLARRWPDGLEFWC